MTITNAKGRYDVPCQNLVIMLDADAVVLIVIGGCNGSGMSISADANRAALAADVPKLLRQMADDAERDLKAPMQNVPHYHTAKGGGGGAS
jgi:hypothetical protein